MRTRVRGTSRWRSTRPDRCHSPFAAAPAMLCVRKIRTELSVGSACHQPPYAPGHPTVPTPPRHRQGIRLVGFHHHGDAHAVTVAGGEHRHAEHSSCPTLVRRELVRGHHGARFRAQQAHTVHLSTTKEDAGEGKIVVQRRPETLTSRLEGHVVRPFRERVPARRRRQGGQLPLGVEPAEARAASSLLSRNDETRVAHAQRPEDAPLEDHAERCIFETRDEEAEQVGRQSVMKASPRLIDQRQGGESCDPLIGAEGVVDRALRGLRRRRERSDHDETRRR